MTEEQKAALEWLDWLATVDKQCATTLKAMLAEPRLPEELTQGLRIALNEAYQQALKGNSVFPAWDIYNAIRAHLTKPKTKTVEVWRVEFAGPQPSCRTYRTAEEARIDADRLRAHSNVSCIHVTGPHTQEVPA